MEQVNVANDLTQLIMPLIGVLVSGIIALSIKDYITKLAKGLAFAINHQPNENERKIQENQDKIEANMEKLAKLYGGKE